MWRVALSTVAVLVDAFFLLLMGIGVSQTGLHSQTRVRVDLPSGAQAPVHHDVRSAAVVGMIFISAVFALNILAILFGARLKLPGNRLKATSAVFE